MFRKYCLSEPHMFSIGFRSGDSVPVKIATLVAPLFDMPPQMCTLMGCLAEYS